MLEHDFFKDFEHIKQNIIHRFISKEIAKGDKIHRKCESA